MAVAVPLIRFSSINLKCTAIPQYVFPKEKILVGHYCKWHISKCISVLEAQNAEVAHMLWGDDQEMVAAQNISGSYHGAAHPR